MPVSPQANQMSMLQQAMQQLQAQQQLAPMIQKLMQAQQQQQQPGMQQTNSPTGQGQGLAAMLGGAGALGAGSPQQPTTLGVNQPIPMQMPPADPQGQQQPAPLPPDPTAMGQ